MGGEKCSRKLKTLMLNRRKMAQKCCFFHSAEAAALGSLHEHRESRVQSPPKTQKKEHFSEKHGEEEAT